MAEADEAIPAGARVGRYELISPLGRGGIGEVWEAVLHGPQGFRKRVALKLVRPQVEPRAGRDSLVHEARIGALLSHPNVVGILELGWGPVMVPRPSDHDVGEGDTEEAEGRWFIAMELVRGASITELARAGPLPAAAVVEIGMQICAGLHHVHGLTVEGRPAGLVHRDVKPRNLLLDRSGLVRLADLGVARLGGPTGDDVSGTPGYMAPEQLEAREDHRADLFALGVSLYELAARRKPFGVGLKALKRVLKVEEDLVDPGFLAPVDAAVPGLGPVLARCLRRDPEERWQTAAELGMALAAVRARLPAAPPLQGLLGRIDPSFAEAPGARTSASDAVTHGVAPGSLPRPRDRFVGRHVELAEAMLQLRGGADMVTLLGPGGVGKTRLAIEVAHRLRSEISGGAWFCDLSEAHTLEGLCAVIGSTLGVPLRGEPVHAVGNALRGRDDVLLLMDNAEGVASPVRALAAALRDAAPDTQLLVTSQVALRLASEVLVDVGPLGRAAGKQLFRERCPRPLSPDDVGVVEALVERLDGLPLAIELAAARTRSLPVRAILNRLQDRFRLLAGGGAERPARHRSLRASLEASWALLQPHEQVALSQLSVLVGQFSVEAAEAVLDLSAWPDAPWALDVVATLSDHSLLQVDSGAQGFRLLRSVREFAEEHQDPTARRAAEARHGAFFAQRGTPSALGARRLPATEELRTALRGELDDIMAASRRAADRGDGSMAASAALAAWQVLSLRGPLGQGTALLQAALAAGPGEREVSVREALGAAFRLQGRLVDARNQLEAALTLQRRHRGRHSEGTLLGQLGLVGIAEGKVDEARACLQTELTLARALGDRREEASALGNLGVLFRGQGQLADAERCYREALVLHDAMGEHKIGAIVRGNLGNLHREAGRLPEARICYERALPLHQRVGNRMFEGIVRGNIAGLDLAEGHHAEALAGFAAALTVHREVGNLRSEAIALGNLASLHHDMGRPDAALRISEALRVAHRIGDRRVEAVFLGVAGRIAMSEGRLGEAAATLSRSSDTLRRIGDSLELAKVLCASAELEAIQGRGERAAHVLAEARRLAAEVDAGPGSELHTLLVSTEGALQVSRPGLAPAPRAPSPPR